MRKFRYVLIITLSQFLLLSCSDVNNKLEKKIETLVAILNNTEPNSDYVNKSGIGSAKISSKIFPAASKDEEEAVIYFLNDQDDNLYAIGIKTKRYGAYFETVDGTIIDYKNGSDIKNAFKKRNTSTGVNCRQLVARTGITNSALVACMQAACNAANCRFNSDCGGNSQSSLDMSRNVFCLTPDKNGIYCLHCLE